MLRDIGGNRKQFYRIGGIMFALFLVTVLVFHLVSMHGWNHLDELGNFSIEELQETKDNFVFPLSNPMIFHNYMNRPRQIPMDFQRDELIKALINNGFDCSGSDPAWDVAVTCARQVYRDEAVFTIYGGAGLEGDVYIVTFNYTSNASFSESSLEVATIIFGAYSDIFLVHLEQELLDTLMDALLRREEYFAIDRYEFNLEYFENSVEIMVWYWKGI